MSKILITGGLGYIGSTLVERLVENKQHEIKIADIEMFPIQPEFELFLMDNGVEVVNVNICDFSSMMGLVKECDLVVHLAGLRLPECNLHPESATLVNEIATINIGKLCEIYQKRMIFSSTCSNYGISNSLANEESQLLATSMYAQTKTNAEKFLLENVPECTVCRFATAFGVGSNFTRDDVMINNFVKLAKEKGTIDIFNPMSNRPNLHVKDIAMAIEILINSKPQHQVYNIGFNSLNATKQEIAEIISGHTDCKITTVDEGDPRDYKVDFYRFCKEFNFIPEYNLGQGISELIISS